MLFTQYTNNKLETLNWFDQPDNNIIIWELLFHQTLYLRYLLDPLDHRFHLNRSQVGSTKNIQMNKSTKAERFLIALYYVATKSKKSHKLVFAVFCIKA